MSAATLTSKGRITIPADVRRRLGLNPGDRVEFVEMANGTVAIKSTVDGMHKKAEKIAPEPND